VLTRDQLFSAGRFATDSGSAEGGRTQGGVIKWRSRMSAGGGRGIPGGDGGSSLLVFRASSMGVRAHPGTT